MATQNSDLLLQQAQALDEHARQLLMQVEALKDQAERCRRLSGATYDREVSEVLGIMAEDYQRSADDLCRKAEL